jgi:hypothetical protein
MPPAAAAVARAGEVEDFAGGDDDAVGGRAPVSAATCARSCAAVGAPDGAGVGKSTPSMRAWRCAELSARLCDGAAALMAGATVRSTGGGAASSELEVSACGGGVASSSLEGGSAAAGASGALFTSTSTVSSSLEGGATALLETDRGTPPAPSASVRPLVALLRVRPAPGETKPSTASTASSLLSFPESIAMRCAALSFAPLGAGDFFRPPGEPDARAPDLAPAPVGPPRILLSTTTSQFYRATGDIHVV